VTWITINRSACAICIAIQISHESRPTSIILFDNKPEFIQTPKT